MGTRLATPADSDALRTMLENAPMGDQIRLTFERSPDFFHGSAIQAEKPEVVVAETADGEIAGVCSAGSRRVFVKGEPRIVRYLSDLRIDPTHRGRTWLARGWRHLREKVFAEGEYAQTLILSDNPEVLELLTSRRKGLPLYQPCGSYLTHFLPASQRQAPPDSGVRKASPSDVKRMQTFLNREGPKKAFFPAYDLSQIGQSDYFRDQFLDDYFLAFNDDQELIGMLGVWDQSGFKQTRIVEYRGAMRLARPFSRLFTGVNLPNPGEYLVQRSIHTVLCKRNDPSILTRLLRAAFADQKTFPGYLVIGLDEKDTLNQALSSFRKRTIEGRHFLVTFSESATVPEGPFYFESARI